MTLNPIRKAKTDNTKTLNPIRKAKLDPERTPSVAQETHRDLR